MYEHAYHIEFGANTTAYVAAFMRNIDWGAVAKRYLDATKVSPPRRLEQPEFGDVPSITPEEVQQMLDSGQRVQVIDTRPRHSSTRAHDIVEGAVWRDPDRVDEWIGTLSKNEPVVTFCVYGFTSAARPPQRCDRRVSTRDTWRAATTRGRRSKDRSSSSSESRPSAGDASNPENSEEARLKHNLGVRVRRDRMKGPRVLRWTCRQVVSALVVLVTLPGCASLAVRPCDTIVNGAPWAIVV